MAAPQYPNPNLPNLQLFMRNIPYLCTPDKIHSEIARVLHEPQFGFTKLSAGKINFYVHLFRDRKGSRIHSGKGTLTLPTLPIRDKFMADFGVGGRNAISLFGRTIIFEPSNRRPPQAEIQRLIDAPYINPSELRKEEERIREINATRIELNCIQFGWDCRDSCFSNEWELSLRRSHQIYITLEGERREIRIVLSPLDHNSRKYTIAVSIPQIQFLTVDHRECAIHFSLFSPPSYESDQSVAQDITSMFQSFLTNAAPLRDRHSFLPFSNDTGETEHKTIAPYLSKSIRCICASDEELNTFTDICKRAGVTFHRAHYPVSRRNLFSHSLLERITTWLAYLPYRVAFQVELLVRGECVDFQEMMSLRPRIEQMIRNYGEQHTAGVLRQFGAQVRDLWYDEKVDMTLIGCFQQAESEYHKQKQAKQRSSVLVDDGNFNCLHVSVTPTTQLLDGPYPERTNRVLRNYEANQDSFLRVSFVDDNQLMFKFDREINGREFIKGRVGHFLKEGLVVGGRRFEFLAYSQSALKEHTVWFCAPFIHQTDLGPVQVDCRSIINELGTFKDIYCPARYAARLSQAFTATDASITLDPDEISLKPDIAARDDKWCHTDGNGCFSPQIGEDIHQALQAKRRKGRRAKASPVAIQVRLGGSKGVLHRDYRLTGRTVILRPSMLKFDAPDSRNVEIARIFDEPGMYYLNRPLIMILEHLGIPYETIEGFQDRAVEEAREATHSIGRAAHLLESHGLGASFRLPTVLLNLKKIGILDVENHFYSGVMDLAVNHVLRGLQQKARIPIPGAYTLVGIADVHGFLNEGEIFACIQYPGSGKKIYLEGDVLVSRSPTIHPGDVRVVKAIGRPPSGSCFDHEPLANTVVFATKGDRPLPSCLGGGDLDGDEYNLIPLENPENPELSDFRPKRQYPPGEYEPAKRHILNRPSTMDDVADFVVEYINSDVLGIIAINWLIIADQSEHGVFDSDCLKLSQLHSDAVDYPKSGVPVSVSQIPRLKIKAKPDWNAPETVKVDLQKGKYYESKRYIGRLFRKIDLRPLNIRIKMSQRRPRHIREVNGELDDLEHLNSTLARATLDEDPIYGFLMMHISKEGYIDPQYIPRESEEEQHLEGIYSAYATELNHICTMHSLSRAQGSMLSEEEAVTGTIAAKTSQPRKRKDMMAKLRQQTDILVRRTRDEITGDEDTQLERSLRRGCLALELAIMKKTEFGAKSFSWVALSVIFEMMRDIDEEQRRFMRDAVRRR